MRWKLMIPWIVAGFLGVLLIGCANITVMTDPATQEIRDIPNNEVDAYKKKGWVVVARLVEQPATQAQPVIAQPSEGLKKKTTSASTPTGCQDRAEAQPIPLPKINLKVRRAIMVPLLFAAEQVSVVLRFAPQASGCSNIYSSRSSPCSDNALQTCTGSAAVFCGAQVTAAAGGVSTGFTCGPHVNTGLTVGVVGATSCYVFGSPFASPNNVFTAAPSAGGGYNLTGQNGYLFNGVFHIVHVDAGSKTVIASNGAQTCTLTMNTTSPSPAPGSAFSLAITNGVCS